MVVAIGAARMAGNLENFSTLLSDVMASPFSNIKVGNGTKPVGLTYFTSFIAVRVYKTTSIRRSRMRMVGWLVCLKKCRSQMAEFKNESWMDKTKRNSKKGRCFTHSGLEFTRFCPQDSEYHHQSRGIWFLDYSGLKRNDFKATQNTQRNFHSFTSKLRLQTQLD